GAETLNISGLIHTFCQQWISRIRSVLGFEFAEAQFWRQPAGVAYFQPVCKQHHLHTAVAGIVAVGYRIYSSFCYGCTEDFIRDRSRNLAIASANGQIDFRKNKTSRHIYLLK